ncbi:MULTISPECIES: EAL and HDOD domain-containing protein [Pseudoalteromonas]|uniref:Putative signal transduction protein containing EAL and modified HD-GYP domain protein n=1 Tax=Pseudoalteromonas luteoviolacea (strain 2ta16) TaxID=1353533 RepID=V4HXB9_PSEL2|nr:MULTISPECIES: HDOD domain-containing protein [Pseudoalteromonas]ESP94428.1 putative signal transduction protein containing EAL and modified HD-GYP domain protein [Pseudoalteromonas luteoviolacea 2ta16]KZN32121.1 histidine kinase [Pseudoalteromonas luteoviolacea NCIMB 1944]MCG7547924.1 HDOD domain-containing protein [Pseudoalteromonas sp. Of7M-16]
MKVFVARQAIFNRKKHVVAYELLFRDGTKNSFPNVAENAATAKLIMDNQLNLGTRYLTSGKKALINIGEDSLNQELAQFLPADDVILELLETIPPTSANYEKVRQLFHSNYRLALDDFNYSKEWEPFLKLARLVKFDLVETPLEQIEPLVNQLKKRKNLKLLAEKVETEEEFITARNMGFSFFQGYFFAKPTMIAQNDIEINYAIVMLIYAEALKPNMNIPKIAELFAQDTALAYKLLRLINSGVFPIKNRIESLKQALVYLGHERIIKFVNLIMTAHVAETKPTELTRLSIVRSRFCELLSRQVAPSLTSMSFLTGLFSLLDAILDKPMDVVVERLPFPELLRDALVGEPNTLFYILNIVKAYESGSWWAMQEACTMLNISDENLPEFHAQAVSWADMYREHVYS